ncbi:MAG: tripartite tricarboxylate transporter substrate binding protein [Betaproteobacteria bacterium]|nr:tripartite tricarboxylate transporter substrate binding protein [Betaproteobacteria bacterium]
MKKIYRCAGAILAGLVLGFPAQAAAQAARADAGAAKDYPNKPVRWIVPFPPGASNDIIARLVTQKLAAAWGQQFVVDNRPGAGGSLGGSLVAQANPDGYTLLHANPGPNINNILMRRKPPYRMNDFSPVVFLGYAPLIIVANPGFAPNSAKELVEYAKANPGKVNWASSGSGSSLHIGLALFQAATGVDVVHVPYKGTAPALTDIVGGQIHLMYTTSVSGEAHIKAQRVKVLGIAGPKRQDVLPNVPTLVEQGIKNAEATVWFGVAVPAQTPRAIVSKLNAEINKALGMADVRQRLHQLGLIVGGGTPEEFGAFMNNEAQRLTMLIKTGRIGLMD